jgi:hypothetical protein
MMSATKNVLGKDGVECSIHFGGTILRPGKPAQIVIFGQTRRKTKWREVAERGVNLPESAGGNPGTEFPIRSKARQG